MVGFSSRPEAYGWASSLGLPAAQAERPGGPSVGRVLCCLLLICCFMASSFSFPEVFFA